MNTDGFPFNRYCLITYPMMFGLLAYLLEPLLLYTGRLTGTGELGALSIAILCMIMKFVIDAKKFSDYRENEQS